MPHLAPDIWWWNRSTVFSIDRLRSDIGWEPQHDLASMFEHTFEWYQRSGRAQADATRFDWSFEDARCGFSALRRCGASARTACAHRGSPSAFTPGGLDRYCQ